MPAKRIHTLTVHKEWSFDPATGNDASDYHKPSHEVKSSLKQHIREAAESLGVDITDITLTTQHANYTQDGRHIHANLKFEVALHGFWDMDDNPRPEPHQLQQQLERFGFDHSDYTITG